MSIVDYRVALMWGCEASIARSRQLIPDGLIEFGSFSKGLLWDIRGSQNTI